MQMATKQDQQTSPEQQSSKKKRSWKSLLLKAAFTGFCMLFFYSAYLDWQIRSKMDGQIWRLPAEVYSRIESIRLSNELSLVLFTYTRFPGVRLKPLIHLSVESNIFCRLIL